MKISAGNPYTYSMLALKLLESSKDYATDYIWLRLEFFNKFQKKTVFPTSITMEFFENIVYWIPRGDFVDNKEKSEYVANFNSWLKYARTVK